MAEHCVSDGGETSPSLRDSAANDQPGFEDKSLGQAGQQDEDLADELMDEAGGDEDEAGRRFEERSKGHPARQRQGHPETG